ncbi:MAG: Hsp20/alpha crystallin family protein [Pseudobdellovibrionaceae bacterium]
MRVLSPISANWSWPRRSLSSSLPSEEMGDVFNNFDNIVDNFLRPTYGGESARTANFQPHWGVSEGKDHYLVSFDIPGVKKEDIKIEIQGNQLSVSGERQREVSERVYGKFEQTFMLPPTISADKIEAHYENGVLSIALPKAEAAKGRSIQIQSGKESFFSRLLGPKEEEVKQ